MVVNRRKKVHKYRGGVTHGGGSRKKRRGAGSRGGRGNAGTGKRAGQKKAGMPPALGKRGFLPRRGVQLSPARNLYYFTSVRLEKLLREEKVTKEADVYIISLAALGIAKLLGTGAIYHRLKIIDGQVSEKAKEKIKAAGGDIMEAEPSQPEDHKTAKESE